MAVSGSWQPPRPCEVYRAEWELCRSAGHVLYHYYVHGKPPDCRQWLRDLASCREWEESRSAEAQRSLCESEQARVQAAQKHTLVWALRQSPLKTGTFLCHRRRTEGQVMSDNQLQPWP